MHSTNLRVCYSMYDWTQHSRHNSTNLIWNKIKHEKKRNSHTCYILFHYHFHTKHYIIWCDIPNWLSPRKCRNCLYFQRFINSLFLSNAKYRTNNLYIFERIAIVPYKLTLIAKYKNFTGKIYSYESRGK